MKNEKWLTVKQYAKLHNIAQQTVRAKIKAQTIPSKKIKGVMNVLDTTPELQEQETTTPASTISEQQLADLQYSIAIKDSKQLQNELKRQKLRNLQQDTLIKKQKQTYTKQKYRQEYAEGVFQAFTESFSNIKNLIIELKLSKENNNKFKKIFSQCIKKFEINLKKYLAEADKKELEQNEADKIE